MVLLSTAALVKTYALLLRGAMTLDIGTGRRTRALGPIVTDVAADREIVFDVIAAPYLGRTPRALRSKLRVLERGDDLVLAEHYTKVGRRTAVTVETVRFERPDRVHFRLVRGPVPQVTETFELVTEGTGTRLTYAGVLGTDLWALGAIWGNAVARKWEQTVATSIASIKQEAERRDHPR